MPHFGHGHGQEDQLLKRIDANLSATREDLANFRAETALTLKAIQNAIAAADPVALAAITADLKSHTEKLQQAVQAATPKTP